MPLNLLWGAVFSSVLLSCWYKKAAAFLLSCFASLFLIFGFFPVGYNMLVYLETQYNRPQSLPENIHGIIVLGGAFNSELYQYRGMIAASSNVTRMIDFVDLAQRYPHTQKIFSGGSGLLHQPTRKEADDVDMFLDMMGITLDNLIYERESRNTYENILFSQQIAQPKDGERWIVVSSGYHLPRVMSIAKELEWNLIPYPSGPKTYGDYRFWPHSLNVLTNFHYLGIALKEFVGSAVYFITGKGADLLV